MNDLEKRVRQLEIENIGTLFQLSFLMEKFDISMTDLQDFARKSIEEMPDSETGSDIHLYLQGFISGKSLD